MNVDDKHQDENQVCFLHEIIKFFFLFARIDKNHKNSYCTMYRHGDNSDALDVYQLIFLQNLMLFSLAIVRYHFHHDYFLLQKIQMGGYDFIDLTNDTSTEDNIGTVLCEEMSSPNPRRYLTAC